MNTVTWQDLALEKANVVGVYGSLRKGMGNHSVIKDADYMETVEMDLPFTMISLGAYPALIPTTDGSTNKIIVELYRLEEVAQLKRLDALEGYNGDDSKYNLYGRQIINHEGIDFWIYYMEGREYFHSEVTHGDWVKHYLGERLK